MKTEIFYFFFNFEILWKFWIFMTFFEIFEIFKYW